MYPLLFSLFICGFCISWTTGSIGDRSFTYQNCLQQCQKNNCGDAEWDNRVSLYMKLLNWNCLEECRYSCMWTTVAIYNKLMKPTPQFHGKWPFKRIVGLQEPASVLFSLLNGVTTVVGLYKYVNTVFSDAPLYVCVKIHAILAVNAWLWSIVFHARDFWWTEKLDYHCATSLVFFSFYILTHRLSYEILPSWRFKLRWLSALLLGTFYVMHVSYLNLIKFDYGFNMLVNISVGIINSVGWLGFCFYKYKKSQIYMIKMACAVILTDLFLCLEICDFSPILWTFDAHSLWHMFTIPLPIIYYDFFKEDSLYLRSIDLHKYKQT